MPNPDLTDEQLARLTNKPAKGSLTLERREKRAQIRTHEKDQKALVVQRDGAKNCRLVPHCPEREKFETAHLDDKGMGGDHGLRTVADRMIRSCIFHHQGARSLHSKDLKVEYLSDQGTNGAIAVWARDERGKWFLLKRETACNVTERD